METVLQKQFEIINRANHILDRSEKTYYDFFLQLFIDILACRP